MAGDSHFVSTDLSSQRFDERWRALARQRYRRLAASIYLIVFFIGAALGTLVYWQGQRLIAVTMDLITQEMYSQEIIADLEVNVVRIEPVLYEYYATEDTAKFRTTYKSLRLEIGRQIELLSSRLHYRNELRLLPAILARVYRITDRLDRNLASSKTDWDLARDALAAISKDLVKVRNALDQLAESVGDQVASRSKETRDLVDETVALALAFAVVTFLTILAIGYFVTNALTTELHRRWLTTFLERNANPILSISESGEVLYANPSAAKFIENPDSTSDIRQALLPGDAMSRLERMRQAGSRYQRWEYSLGNRFYGCGVHHLKDTGAYHVYISDITKRKKDEQQLEWAAYHDALTGLPNRRRFTEDLQTALLANSQGVILAISIDRFRDLIEGMGHDVSDAVLFGVGQSLDTYFESLRKNGHSITLYHFGGDHFTVLADDPKCTREGGMSLAEGVIEHCKAPMSAADREFFLTVSIGVNHYKNGKEDWATILKRAEGALKLASQEGGNTARQHSTELENETLRRLELEHALRRAVNGGDLYLELQPQLDVRANTIVGLEALVRWTHPDLGTVSPAQFIPLAEETGVIDELGRWVLQEACRQIKQLYQWGYRNLSVAVNVSPRQIADPVFPATVAESLAQAGLPGAALHLEVTETAAMLNPKVAVEVLSAVRELGVKIAVDDFGTGYSSLAYMKMLPLNKLKIDRSFIRGMGESRDDAAIVAATVELAHKLGLAVTAEGVETDEQRRKLISLGCEEIQGFLIARPMKLEVLADFLADWSGQANQLVGN